MNGDFGALGPLVGAVGSLIAAAGAILLTWRGRARWEPSETDIPSGPQRVGGLAIAVLVAVLYFSTRAPGAESFLPGLAVGLVLICVVVLLVYSFFTSTQTFEDSRRRRRVIGGFTLTPRARDAIAPGGPAEPPTVQQLFERGGFDPDLVWPRQSRALAKVSFVLFYLLLVVSGTMALASAAILIEKTTPGAASSAGPSASPGGSPSPSASTSPSPTASPVESLLSSCVAPAGPSTFPRLTAADPTISSGTRLCLLYADMYTVGSGEGLVRVLAGSTELIRFDMLDFDSQGTEGAGSGERHLEFDPSVGVPQGVEIRLDASGCLGEACTRLEIVFAATSG
jgi:hypothetical protein